MMNCSFEDTAFYSQIVCKVRNNAPCVFGQCTIFRMIQTIKNTEKEIAIIKCNQKLFIQQSNLQMACTFKHPVNNRCLIIADSPECEDGSCVIDDMIRTLTELGSDMESIKRNKPKLTKRTDIVKSECSFEEPTSAECYIMNQPMSCKKNVCIIDVMADKIADLENNIISLKADAQKPTKQ